MILYHSHEVVLDDGHLEVGTVCNDRTTDINLEVTSACWLVLFRDLLVDCLGGHGEANSVLVAWQVRVVQGNFTAGHHSDLYCLVLAEPVEDLLEGHRTLLQDDLGVVSVAFGDHCHWSAHDGVEFLRLVLNDIIGLAHHD